MKRIKLLLASIFTLMCCASCEGIDDLLNSVTFNVLTSSDVFLEIPAIGRTETIERELVTADYFTDIDAKIKARYPTQSIRDIKSLKISKCTLTLTDGDLESPNNFSSFESISVSLAYGTSPYTTFFRVDSPDSPALMLSAQPVTVDLTPVFSKPGPYHCKISGKMRRPTTRKLRALLHLTYELKVQN